MPEYWETNETTKTQEPEEEEITEGKQEEPLHQHKQPNDSDDSDSTRTQEFNTKQHAQAQMTTPEQPVRRVQFDDNMETPNNPTGIRRRTSTSRDTQIEQSPQQPPFTPIRPRNPTPAPKKKDDDLMDQLIYVQQVTQDLQAKLERKAAENEELQQQLMHIQTTQGQDQRPIPLHHKPTPSWDNHRHTSAPPTMTSICNDLPPNRPKSLPAQYRPARLQNTPNPQRNRYQPIWDTLIE